MSFSERYGYVKPRDVIQLDGMDSKLRVALWNLLTLGVWDGYQHSYRFTDPANRNLRFLTTRLWTSFYHRSLDDRPDYWGNVLDIIKGHFFSCPWFEVYDVYEFIVNNFEFPGGSKSFVKPSNEILTRHMSAYRIVDGMIVRMTDEQEIAEIESALGGAVGSEQIHIKRALELLSDRDNPDYRNSIKESISAVESLVQTALGEKGTLGQLLKKLEEKTGLHGSLKGAFSSLYGYASDEGGIRHAMLEEANIKFEDAKFMLVACSAFINLVKVKLSA